MSVNYDYIVQLASRLSALERPRALDYGCGAGGIVKRALDAGMDCYGIDVFYGGGSLKQAAADTGLLGERIFEMEDGRIPMDSESFDIVFANQVFEHIDDFTQPLSEIDRVLKADGVFINIFPSAQVWREGHIGIPFAHWYPKGTTVPRLYYVLLLRYLGFGYYKGDKTHRQWSVDALRWIDDWAFYKPMREIDQLFAERFSLERFDDDYMAFRIENHSRLRVFANLARTSLGRCVMAFAASRLASHVYVLRKAK